MWAEGEKDAQSWHVSQEESGDGERMPPEEEEEEEASSSSLLFQKVTVAGARPKKKRLQFSPLPPSSAQFDTFTRICGWKRRGGET